MKKYECLFVGNLGTLHGNPYDIKLKPDAESYQVKPFPVPRIHALTFKQEVNRIEYLKVINKVNCSQLGASTFLIPSKDEHQKCFDAIKRVIGREVLSGLPGLQCSV